MDYTKLKIDPWSAEEAAMIKSTRIRVGRNLEGFPLGPGTYTPQQRAAIEQKQIAGQLLLRAKTEVEIAAQEALRYETLNKGLNDQVLYKLFLDKWDGNTQVVPGLPGSNGGNPPVIVGGNKR